MTRIIKKILQRALPAPLFKFLIGTYHFLFSWGATLFYGFPSRSLFVIGVTGTKGKSSVTEMVNAILEEAGYRTALANTIRFKIGGESRANLFKMTMPGRGFLQSFLAEAKRKSITHVVLEVSSEGAQQFRHAGIELNALIFTNIAPEHIEAHGSFEAYKQAKLNIGASLMRSSKRPRIIVANAEDELGKKFLVLGAEHTLPFGLKNAEPYETKDNSVSMTFDGVTFSVPFPGIFTIQNALAAATLGKSLGISGGSIGRALQNMQPILGRAERVDMGQNFTAVVDYAHTPDSMKALFEAYSRQRKICVFGATGGGRDSWKRPEMGRIADEYCAEVILTNDDPYDEDPLKIIGEIEGGMKRKPHILIDRREAIRLALSLGKSGDVVLIVGKGTDPFLMEAGGKKTPWNDAAIVREELQERLAQKDVR